jgi:hypothetical protein
VCLEHAGNLKFDDMARQSGIIKLKGSVGDLSFYKSVDGFVVRRKGGPDGYRIKNAPQFVRTRENNSEFGRASRAGKLLRSAFRTLLRNSADGRMTSRLTQIMLKAIKDDRLSDRGQRSLTEGAMMLVEGFEFNINASVDRIFRAPFISSIDRVAGKLTVTFPEFAPATVLALPGASHCRLVIGGAEIDFSAGQYLAGLSKSVDVDLSAAKQGAFVLDVDVTAGSLLPLFLVFGITFLQEVNGQRYPLQNGGTSGLRIAKIESLVTAY